MEYCESGNVDQKKINGWSINIFTKICFIILLISISYIQVMAQVSPDTTRSTNQTTFLLPDGRVLVPEKWDSLEKAWGKNRIMFRHNEKDDAKGITHLVRLTDEMKQQFEEQGKERENVLAAMLNKPAPDFELIDMQGKQWSLKKLRGKIVVLNFWFSSCVPCIQELPELNTLTGTYDSKNVVFLGFTFDNAAQVKNFLSKYKFNYTLLPNSYEVDKNYQVSSWPTSMVIDKEGNIKRIIQLSSNIREELGTIIDSLL